MGSVDLTKMWMNLLDPLFRLEDAVGRPEVVPHEESDLHRVFCDEQFCLERDAAAAEE